MMQLVIDRTFDGYMTEIKTVYGQLEKELGVKIEPAPDEWDRLYNVDFFIKVKEKYIGIQIKPVNQGIQLSQIFKERDLQPKLMRNLPSNMAARFSTFSHPRSGKEKKSKTKK